MRNRLFAEPLAVDGGRPARSRPEPPMFPGGMEIGDEEIAAVTRVLRSRNVFRYYGVGDGPGEVDALEREFAAHVGARHALAVNAGSAALICALAASGIGRGDEVILPAYTWNATPNAILAVGAVPVLAEVDDTLTLDPADVAAKVSERTRAILPVHMRGGPADLEPLLAIARDRSLVLVEDVCQAAGASYHGRRLGTWGDAGAFSLQFNKVITTGEGGLLVTDSAKLHDLAIDVHDCAGRARRGEGVPRWPGYNFRASELVGALGRVQLRRLDSLLERMRERHAWLAERVAELPGLALRGDNDLSGSAGLALIAFAEEPELARRVVDALQAEGVGALQLYSPELVDLHVYAYWQPVHDALAAAGYNKASCPRTLDLLARAVHVDVSPQLEQEDLDEIAFAFEKVARTLLA
ncbi:MAG TPA: DegT/DnrJ/EryC1/StrS family aminotransferase [Gaiellaceae bacterium]|nr:DegT/DnrJ/EryC1/StrS family aminotransferase [Gaiellaceae bacterium]